MCSRCRRHPSSSSSSMDCPRRRVRPLQRERGAKIVVLFAQDWLALLVSSVTSFDHGDLNTY